MDREWSGARPPPPTAARDEKIEGVWAEERALKGVWSRLNRRAGRWRSRRRAVYDIIGREASDPGLVVCGWWCYSPFK